MLGAVGNSRVLLLIVYMATLIAMSRLMFSALAPLIKAEFMLNYLQVGSPTSAALVFAALAYGSSGFLTYRFGPRVVLLLATAMMITGALGTATSTNFALLVLFQGTAGLGEGFFYVSAIVLLTNLYSASKVGRVVGIMEGALNFGVVLALIVGTGVSALFGWRNAYLLLSVLGVLVIIFEVRMLPKSMPNYHHTYLRKMFADPFIATLFVLVSLFFVVYWSFWGFVPTYLIDQLHIPYVLSGFLGAFCFIFASLAAFAGGMLLDKVGVKRASLLVIILSAFFLALFALTRIVFLAAISLMVVLPALGSWLTILIASFPKRYPRHELGRMYGILFSVSYLVGSFGPIFVGHIADTYGFTSGFLLLVVLLGLAGLIVQKRL